MNRTDIEKRAAINPEWAQSVYDQLLSYRLAMTSYWTTRVAEAVGPKAIAAAQKTLDEWSTPSEMETTLASILEPTE
ncbi:MAG: hypothetical protein IKE60_26325 [Reyranella sp.]|uniref:hypothetical protein n=1 Tax=Reyranella sp. TaxID=1929291 RepID=UPI0025F67CCA|nr:hypothetical protein [Reyranella sp.]MBR2818206.1 hypothetical protein [Reyranella sp.]